MLLGTKHRVCEWDTWSTPPAAIRPTRRIPCRAGRGPNPRWLTCLTCLNVQDGLSLGPLQNSGKITALTHLAEAGESAVMLMAKSRHRSLQTLQRYARPGPDAVADMTARHDPDARRRPGRPL
jgi:hypothetical protein